MWRYDIFKSDFIMQNYNLIEQSNIIVWSSIIIGHNRGESFCNEISFQKLVAIDCFEMHNLINNGILQEILNTVMLGIVS